MAKLGGIAKLIKASQSDCPANQFNNDLGKIIQLVDMEDVRPPSKAYKPSSMGGCLRNIYFQMTGAQMDEDMTSVNLIGICESGTSRHDILQGYIVKMKEKGFDCEWIDVEEFINKHELTDLEVISKEGHETKVFHKKLNMRFLCDGIIRYKGKYYILEIKTESTYKYGNHDEPFEEHKVQASCYSECFGIKDVIFLYEDRDNSSKKAYLVQVTDEMRKYVTDKIEECDLRIEREDVPPKDSDTKKCRYCKYKGACKEVEKCLKAKSSKTTSNSRSRKRTKIEF